MDLRIGQVWEDLNTGDKCTIVKFDKKGDPEVQFDSKPSHWFTVGKKHLSRFYTEDFKGDFKLIKNVKK